ncbi:hypothetical protein BU14_0153s0035 [Porphyra umbilicalis]|uniref:Uncharacterized protein n=1 Tax=Porphyra umbilicalis TaxID=2786 RepID=A0A1X6P9J9_PORUM|nr:hypothetical protein BU14_0153s0035 [Porphyra umbilicalis]|eukprot:OSX77293.1 hypothetical protein BU14_0153s0035 [Porphyra umbilicalis]
MRLARAATAAAVVVAVLLDASSVSAVSPLPFPVPANNSLGGFHLLASLQCDTTLPGSVGGRRGFRTKAHTFHVDAHACWSPVSRREARSGWSNLRHGADGPTVEYNSSDWQLMRGPVQSLRNTDPTGSFVRDVSYTPLLEQSGGDESDDDGGDGGSVGGDQLFQENDAVRLLTLQRNSIAGAVHRYVGVYDVLALSRVTVGFCRTPTCTDMSAVAIIGTFKSDFYNQTHVPLVVHTVDGGRALPVTMLDEDLLSLGRAVVADPAWLGQAADSWVLRVGFTLRSWSRIDEVGRPHQRRDALGAPWTATNSWDLSAASAAASEPKTAKWLQAVAYVWCRAPMSSFVRKNRAALCGPTGDGAYSTASDAGSAVRHLHTAQWTFDPNQMSPGTNHTLVRGPDDAPLPRCAWATNKTELDGQPLLRPAWLLGREAREINPASAGERALARSLTTCAHPIDGEGSPHRRIKFSPSSQFVGVRATATTLSQAYDRSVWGVEPPEAPVTANNITLAMIVLVPEVIALLVLLLTTATWGRVDLVALGLIFLAGLVSISAIVSLALTEVSGRNWRAASLRDEVSVLLDDKKAGISVFRPLDGRPLFRVETLYLTARLGYRVKLLVSLAGAATALYLILSIAVGVVVARRWRRMRTAAFTQAPWSHPLRRRVRRTASSSPPTRRSDS